MKYYGNFILPLYLPKIEFNLCTPYRPPVSVSEHNSFQQLILFVLQIKTETLIFNVLYFKTMISEFLFYHSEPIGVHWDPIATVTP